MGFEQVLDTWRARGRSTEATRSQIALKTFASAHREVRKNLDRDPNISDALREELLEQLLTVSPVDASAVEGKVESFCRSHQWSGPRDPKAQKLILGHAVERGKLENCLKTGLRKSPFVAGKAKYRVSLFLDAILRDNLVTQRAKLRSVWLSSYMMWSFYSDADASNPYHGVTTSARELRRRLGLGRSKLGSALLFWSHRLKPDQKARVPTTFDGGLNPYYCPGGRTRPLSGRDGLPEVVHPTIQGSQICSPISRAP